MKLYFEAKLGKKLPGGHPLTSWLAVWTADLLSKLKVGPKGVTAYEAITGHKTKHQILPFGERVVFKTQPKNEQRNNMDSEWMVGVFVGMVNRSQEFLIMAKDAVYKVRTVRKIANEYAYDRECLDWATWKFEDYVKKGAKTLKNKVRGTQGLPVA